MNAQDTAAASVEFDPTARSNSVSVVIPLYNGAGFIKATLDSILAQTVPPAEILVIDDESQDDSALIVEAFGPPVTLFRVKNGGAAAARNLGASRAKSNWIALCDQDDLWHPTKLEKQLRLANECPELHCVLTDYVDCSKIPDDSKSIRSHLSYAPDGYWEKEYRNYGFVVRQPITPRLSTFQPAITSTPIVKREFFLASGGFDLDVEWGAEDTCFHFRCLSVVPFGVVPEVLMYHLQHPESGSADPIKQLRKTIVVWEHIISTYPQAQPYRKDLLAGVQDMRAELKDAERYARRQRLKRLIGFK
jgi:glycosyltransferase involved in cell wall biosynthesis